MSTTTPLTDIVLLLGDFSGKGVNEILTLSDNARYKFVPPTDSTAWLGENYNTPPQGPILCLAFGQNIYSPEGWVCGSAAEIEQADIQIAPNNKHGVSRRHFRIDIEPRTLQPRLTVLGQVLRVTPAGGHKFVRYRDQSIDIEHSATIDLGEVKFRAWRPTLLAEHKYKVGARKFSSAALAAVPRNIPSAGGKFTVHHTTRVGKDGKLYVVVEVIGKGSEGTVSRVRKQGSEDEFVAKEPYFKQSTDSATLKHKWEKTKREFEHLVKLQHVSLFLA